MFSSHKKKAITVTVLTGFVAVTILAFVQPQPKVLKNIKAFPANVTFKEVDEAMDQFKEDLGVKCVYCHAPSKENNRKLDMASDANPKKEITRQMMRMTDEMNKKYISTLPHADTAKIQLVTCNTCHRGSAKPVFKEVK